jgi:hypothetical protein
VNERVTSMLWIARRLAAHGHRVQMIKAVLNGSGYPEALAFMAQPHVYSELRDIADRARRAGKRRASDLEAGSMATDQKPEFGLP